MKFKFSILAAAVAAVMFCSCASTTFEVPKIGTRFDDTKMSIDGDGVFTNSRPTV